MKNDLEERMEKLRALVCRFNEANSRCYETLCCYQGQPIGQRDRALCDASKEAAAEMMKTLDEIKATRPAFDSILAEMLARGECAAVEAKARELTAIVSEMAPEPEGVVH